MVIQWYGQSCFKIQSGEWVLAIDPFAKEIGLTPPRFRADIVLVTHAHYDHSNAATIAGTPFVITDPGEYEVGNTFVRGIETFHDNVKGKDRGKNTIYAITLEDIRLLHLGDFGEEKLRDETLEEIAKVDILMIPVGGTYTITAEQAAKVVAQIEPKIVIPMHYKIPALTIDLAEVTPFLKEMGSVGAKSEEKLTLKKKDLTDGGNTAVRVLQVI
ncbi:MAG: beta-lactamase domain-containing protein [Parcubacteria group bacterium Gr01-1014_33]|nr:MAG: beta-lactamase domain-containing protein [Parcubacteria group bacterium Gr01-1014_33]